jgi:1,4-alpha-glucan branching enzyme
MANPSRRTSKTTRSQSRTRETPQVKTINFRLQAREAQSVALAGDFNNWDPSTVPMRRSDEGEWEASLQLSPGQYEYKFVVDGVHWREDPQSQERVANSFGTYNSVYRVAD